MSKLSKTILAVILFVCVLWMVGGAVITSGLIELGESGSDPAASVRALAADASIEIPADFPIPIIFIVSGLPLALLALLALWRGRRSKAKSVAPAVGANMRRNTILVTALALIFALLLWHGGDIGMALGQPDATDLILFPVRLFVTFVHEAGHALAALLSGGEVEGFAVALDGSGVATVRGGSVSLIAPAGYLGAALFGSMLFFLTNRIPQWTRGLSFLMGTAMIALSLAFAMPSAERSPTALIVGIGFGVGLMALGWFAPRLVNVFALTTLAVLTGLNAFFDLWQIVSDPAASSENAFNDAAMFSAEITPLLPAAVVAFIWAAIAVGMMAAAMYFGLIKPAHGEIAPKAKVAA